MAFVVALIVLIWEIANSGLRAFLDKQCADGCAKTVTGPVFSNFTARVVPHPQGGWNAVVGVVVDAQIDCRHAPGPGPDLSLADISQGLAALVKEAEGTRAGKRG